MDIYDTMFRRTSVRRYSSKKVAPDKIVNIKEEISSLKPLHEGTVPKFEIIEDGSRIREIMSGFIGSYGKNNAPHFIVAVSKPTSNSRENVGFMLEQLVLKLTAMDISTCWIGGLFNKNDIKKLADAGEDEVVEIILAFGYAAEGKRKLLNPIKRKSIDDIAYYKTWGNSVKNFTSTNEKIGRMLEAARVAPSAVNLQPWRFVVDEHKMAIFLNKLNPVVRALGGGNLSSMQRIDIGITLSHIYLSSIEEGTYGEFKSEENANTAYSVPDGITYITTCYFNNI